MLRFFGLIAKGIYGMIAKGFYCTTTREFLGIKEMSVELILQNQ